jgi:hypothetical protein
MTNEFKDKLQHIDTWRTKGKNFWVEIKHWFDPIPVCLDYKPEHHWTLYVKIFPKHPLAQKAAQCKNDYDCDLGDKIYPNFHCGCTYYHRTEDYVQIGCDYQHLGDEWFWKQAEMPSEVLADAKDLFEFFENIEKENDFVD